MQVYKYIILFCCAAILRFSLSNDEFLSTPYIIKTIAILLTVTIAIVMIVRDIRKIKKLQQNKQPNGMPHLFASLIPRLCHTDTASFYISDSDSQCLLLSGFKVDIIRFPVGLETCCTSCFGTDINAVYLAIVPCEVELKSAACTQAADASVAPC